MAAFSRREWWAIELTPRQLDILELVRKRAPITADQIAETLGVSRPTLRSDLAVLVMLGHLDAKPKVGYFPGNKLSMCCNRLDKLLSLRVKDRMTRPVAISDQATLSDAVIMVFTEHTSILFVTGADGALLGVLSLKDLLKVTLGNPNAGSIPVSMIMTRLPRVVTAEPDDCLLSAAKKMMEHKLSGLPVVRPMGSGEDRSRLEVVGRISIHTLAEVLVELPGELEA